MHADTWSTLNFPLNSSNQLISHIRQISPTLSKYTFHSIMKINKRYRSANMATDGSMGGQEIRKDTHMELLEVSEALVALKQWTGVSEITSQVMTFMIGLKNSTEKGGRDSGGREKKILRVETLYCMWVHVMNLTRTRRNTMNII